MQIQIFTDILAALRAKQLDTVRKYSLQPTNNTHNKQNKSGGANIQKMGKGD